MKTRQSYWEKNTKFTEGYFIPELTQIKAKFFNEPDDDTAADQLMLDLSKFGGVIYGIDRSLNNDISKLMPESEIIYMKALQRFETIRHTTEVEKLRDAAISVSQIYHNLLEVQRHLAEIKK